MYTRCVCFKVEEQALLPSVRLQASYADSHCSISDAMNAAIEFYAKRSVNMFLGPICDYAVAPIARQVGLLSVVGF